MEEPETTEDPEVTRIRSALLAGLPADVPERTGEQKAKALLADLLGWHRREAKPAWWRYFHVRTLSALELVDEPDALGGLTGTRVAGHIDLGPDHHTPWGVVQGGVYATAVESAAGLGASLAVRDRGQFAVGVHNATDFLRPATSGRAEVVAEPLQQGRVQQPWLVTITDERGRALARGQLRLQNVPPPGTGTN